MPAATHKLQPLLKPRHIAFVGGRHLVDAIHSTQRIGFTGQVWVVNPRQDAIAGYRCYRSIAELPAPPDAAFVAVNSAEAVRVVGELARAGAGGAVCYAAGFAESGPAGWQLQQQLLAAAGDMPLVGPNCYGILNYLDGAAMWPDRHGGHRVRQGVAIISQSGNIALNLTMADRSCPLAYVISVGNQAALGVADYMDSMLADERVRAIGIYLEGLTDVAAFSRAALRALTKGIPVVVLKAGGSAIGTQLTLSHTSSLAGADDIYQALFQRLGIIRVHSLAELLETLKLCAVTGPITGRNLAILTCSGGDSAMAADLAESHQLALPPFDAGQAAALHALLPAFATLSNPLDYNTTIWGQPEPLQRCFDIVMASKAIDVTVLVLDFPKPDTGEQQPWLDAVDALIQARNNTARPAVLVSTIAELIPASQRDKLVANQVTPLQGLDLALRVLSNMAGYGQIRQQALQLPDIEALLVLPVVPPGSTPRVLDEWESKQELASFGLICPAGRLVSAAEAAASARQLGFPLVVKIASTQVPHKTEAGAVRLNLHSAAEVEQAVAEIAANVSGISGAGERYLVEKMVAGPVAEVIVGLKRDPQFGLALVLGSGGILVELIKDHAVLLLPASREAIAEALASLKVWRLLQGFRGRPAGDVPALIDAILAVAAYAEANRDRVLEADINPLLVLPQGQGVVAADALLRVAE